MKGKNCSDHAENIKCHQKKKKSYLPGQPGNWDLWDPGGDYCRELSFGM